MRTRFVMLGVLGCAVLAAAMSRATETTSDANAVERGRYLVDSVAMCAQCHTPRDRDGRLIEERRLMGEAVLVANPFQSGEWARWAPRIAGMPGYSDKEGVRLLTQGVARNGAPPRVPMPPFRMNEADARAVVAYLKSLE
jgi:mono/diheme cytochrome c family protein